MPKVADAIFFVRKAFPVGKLHDGTDVSPRNQNIRQIDFLIPFFRRNNMAVIVAHPRRREFGIFDPQADPVITD